MAGFIRIRILFLTLILFACIGTKGQISIKGTVLNRETTAVVEGVLIKSGKKTTVTNHLGLFILKLSKGESAKLQLMHLAFEEENISVKPAIDTTLTIYITPKQHKLAEITVTSQPTENRGSNISVNTIEMQKRIPLLGEGNINLILQQKPGVAHAQEINPGLYVRGFSSSQNQVIINGSPIFNTNHLLGVYPSVSANAITKTQLLTDNLHPRYGGMLSSCLIMDSNSRPADSSEFIVGVGVLTSHLYSRGAIVKKKLSYLLSARRSYFDLVTKSYNKKNDYSRNSEKLPDYRFYDIIGLVTYQHDSSSKICASTFVSRDKLSQHQNYLGIDATWGNIAANLSWEKNISNKVKMKVNGGYSQYNTNTDIIKSNSNSITNSLQRFYISAEGNLKINETGQVDAGIFGGKTSTSINSNSNEINGNESFLNSKDGSYINKGIYVSISQSVAKVVQLNAGLRLESFRNNQYYLSPRLYAQYSLCKPISFFASYSQRLQFDHLYAPMGINLAIDMTIPCDDTLKPQKSQQVSVGANINVSNEWHIQLSSYYSTLINQIDFINPEPLNDGFYHTTGKGDAKGIEISSSIKKRTFTIEASYSLSQSRRKFDKINDGKWFNPPFDIRHKADLFLHIKINSRWSISASQFVQSGNITTIPTSIYYDNERNKSIPIYTTRYNLRLPINHRLDVAAQYQVVKRFGEVTLNMGIYNVYNQANPYFIYFKPEQIDNEQTRLVAKKRSLLPMVPFFMIEVKI